MIISAISGPAQSVTKLNHIMLRPTAYKLNDTNFAGHDTIVMFSLSMKHRFLEAKQYASTYSDSACDAKYALAKTIQCKPVSVRLARTFRTITTTVTAMASVSMIASARIVKGTAEDGFPSASGQTSLYS